MKSRNKLSKLIIFKKVNRIKIRKDIKICFVIALVVLLLVYVFILEPYCFFIKSVNSDDVLQFTDSQIEIYQSKHLLSNSKNVIVMLIPRVSTKLMKRLQLLDTNFNDNFSTNILFFYTGGLKEHDFLRVAKTMKRQVMFLNVFKVFNLFPIGFDGCATKTPFRVRGKWNYVLMIRFWSKFFFELPQLQQYDYIMRLDDDSEIRGHWFNVFEEMLRKNAVYFANDLDVDEEKKLPGTMLLQNVTADYIKQYNIQPKQPDVLKNAFHNNAVRDYYNNFEVCKMEFFRRREVRHWIDAIDMTHGIFKYRWGDAVLRYLTMALFAEAHEVLHRPNYNLSYCHKC